MYKCKKSKVAFSKADQHEKEMELFIQLPLAITAVICIYIITKNRNINYIYWGNGTNYTFITHMYDAKLCYYKQTKGSL